jgi:hypothetical protein
MKSGHHREQRDRDDQSSRRIISVDRSRRRPRSSCSALRFESHVRIAYASSNSSHLTARCSDESRISTPSTATAKQYSGMTRRSAGQCAPPGDAERGIVTHASIASHRNPEGTPASSQASRCAAAKGLSVPSPPPATNCHIDLSARSNIANCQRPSGLRRYGITSTWKGARAIVTLTLSAHPTCPRAPLVPRHSKENLIVVPTIGKDFTPTFPLFYAPKLLQMSDYCFVCFDTLRVVLFETTLIEHIAQHQLFGIFCMALSTMRL